MSIFHTRNIRISTTKCLIQKRCRNSLPFLYVHHFVRFVVNPDLFVPDIPPLHTQGRGWSCGACRGITCIIITQKSRDIQLNWYSAGSQFRCFRHWVKEIRTKFNTHEYQRKCNTRACSYSNWLLRQYISERWFNTHFLRSETAPSTTYISIMWMTT